MSPSYYKVGSIHIRGHSGSQSYTMNILRSIQTWTEGPVLGGTSVARKVPERPEGPGVGPGETSGDERTLRHQQDGEARGDT